MSFNLSTLNQAWYICCEESLENLPEDATDEEAFIFICERAARHAVGLLHDAAREVNALRDEAIQPRSGSAQDGAQAPAQDAEDPIWRRGISEGDFEE
jgi:chemotaxis signal transduction protein